LDELLDRYHRAADAFSRGDPEPVKALYSEADDVTLANPFGPARRGREAVMGALDYASSRMSDGQVVGFDEIARYPSDGHAHRTSAPAGPRRAPPEPGAPPCPLRLLPRQRHSRAAVPAGAERIRKRPAAEGDGSPLPRRPDPGPKHLPRGHLSYPAAPPAPPTTLAAQGHAVDVWWAGTDPAGKETATIAVPTLVADGTADKLDPTSKSRKLTKLPPNARLQLYPDAGHAFLFQDQATFHGRIESFLG
jgi:pimeloyl-ACP methyl ester carboxylesterase